jgi:hypothetical protein
VRLAQDIALVEERLRMHEQGQEGRAQDGAA